MQERLALNLRQILGKFLLDSYQLFLIFAKFGPAISMYHGKPSRQHVSFFFTHIFPPKGPNMKFLKQNFNFQFLKKTKAMLLPSM